MTSDQRPSFGQRLYRALFKVFGPADVGPAGPPDERPDPRPPDVNCTQDIHAG